MTQCDPAGDRESRDPDSSRPERASDRSDAIWLDEPDAGPPGPFRDSPGTPPAEWAAPAREVLQGLTEEQLQNDQPKMPLGDPGDPSLPADLALTAERKRPPQQRRASCEKPSRPAFTLEQRILILETWSTSRLPGTEFAPLVGVSPHTLYCWRRAFEQEGPAGLVQKPRGAPPGSRLPEVTNVLSCS